MAYLTSHVLQFFIPLLLMSFNISRQISSALLVNQNPHVGGCCTTELALISLDDKKPALTWRPTCSAGAAMTLKIKADLRCWYLKPKCGLVVSHKCLQMMSFQDQHSPEVKSQMFVSFSYSPVLLGFA